MGAYPHGQGSGLAVTPSLCDLSTSFSLSERIAPTAVGFFSTYCMRAAQRPHPDLSPQLSQESRRHMWASRAWLPLKLGALPLAPWSLSRAADLGTWGGPC